MNLARRAVVMWTIGWACALGALVVTCAPANAQEGGIEVFAGETLLEEGMRFSLTHIYKRKDDMYHGTDRIHDPQDRVFEEHRAVAGFDYGAMPDLTFSALVPFVTKELRVKKGARDRRSSSGLGDIAALAKFRVNKDD